MTKRLPQIVQMYKSIGHPIRLRLLAMLSGGPLCVGQMMTVVRLAASTVSEHLSDLRKAGMITERKEGRFVVYRLSDDEIAQQVLEATRKEVAADSDVRADRILLRELRHVPREELCGAAFDLKKLKRPKLRAAMQQAAELRTG